MQDTEDIQFNGATVDIHLSPYAIHYEKVGKNIRVRKGLHKEVFSDPDEDDLLADYGPGMSDEIRNIILKSQGKLDSEQEDEWTTIDVSTVGSMKRSELLSVQSTKTDMGYRIMLNGTSMTLVFFVHDEEQATVLTKLIESYRDIEEFPDIASSFKLSLLEEMINED